jgi:fatty-acyl-CoA synthase
MGVGNGDKVAVLVPINFMLLAEEVAFILRHAGAKTLATDTGLAGLAGLAQAASKLDTEVAQFFWLPSETPTQPVIGMHSFDSLATCTAHPI